ncbi:helix-turn-helix transcriptional regulator [Paenibacillus alba]|nr:helix-turn-helix transcriptional regulator [Paenibacillus alba]
MFPKRLLLMRNKYKKTQQEMADHLGITRPAYTAYESGNRKPDYDTLDKLASYFHTSTDYLLGRTENEVPIETSPETLVNPDDDPLKDPKLNIFFKDWDKLSPERQDEVKAFIRAQLLIEDMDRKNKN